MEKRVTVRAIAWSCLQRWAKGGIFAETLVAREADAHALSHADRSLLQSIVFGTLRQLGWLEHLRYELRSGALEDKIHWLVLSGLCELLVLNHADHAAVSETVKLAPTRARGVVNGMLRNAIRRREEWLRERKTLPLPARYSMPEWLTKRWVREFGRETAEGIMEWNLRVPPVYARLNPLNPMDEVPAEWEALPGVAGWYKVNGPLPLDALKAGQVYVADPSTRYCIQLLKPAPGEKILDACAAPGGKSAAILAATGGEVALCATDSAAHRLKSLQQNLQRAGGKDITVAQHDWSTPCPDKWKAVFDAVLLDVPCSNSGVLQRRVDARWRLSEKEINRLSDLQLQILEQASQAVRPGGRVVYSTCSIDAQEDREVVNLFLAKHPEFSLQDDYLALPHVEQADGAYAACLLRSEMP